jgi:hypothetical protein
MTNYIKIIPDSDSDLDVATLGFLQLAIETPPVSNMSLEEIIAEAYSGEYLIYAIIAPEPCGCIVFKKFGDVLNIVLLGGDNIKIWEDDTKRFCVQKMRELACKNIIIIGRLGWVKYWPELQVDYAVLSFREDSNPA